MRTFLFVPFCCWILACENTTGASSKLQESVYENLSDEIVNSTKGYTAFANVAIDSIVPAGALNTDPLMTVCENFAEIIIDKNVFLGEIPNVDGIILKDNLPAYVERKLFTLNTGHATTAYLGFLKDKKTVFELTRAHYEPLLEAGVRIYEYTPGFMHAKLCVVDDCFATVGSVNLDYRSMFLHFEAGIWLCHDPSILDMKADFLHTLERSEQIDLETCQSLSWPRRVLRAVLRIFAPLL